MQNITYWKTILCIQCLLSLCIGSGGTTIFHVVVLSHFQATSSSPYHNRLHCCTERLNIYSKSRWEHGKNVNRFPFRLKSSRIVAVPCINIKWYLYPHNQEPTYEYISILLIHMRWNDSEYIMSWCANIFDKLMSYFDVCRASRNDSLPTLVRVCVWSVHISTSFSASAAAGGHISWLMYLHFRYSRSRVSPALVLLPFLNKHMKNREYWIHIQSHRRVYGYVGALVAHQMPLCHWNDCHCVNAYCGRVYCIFSLNFRQVSRQLIAHFRSMWTNRSLRKWM